MSPTQTQIEKTRYVPYYPLASPSSSGPIEFHVAGTPEEFIDLAGTQLYVEAKITAADGTDIGENAKAGPVNLWMHSLFSQVDISLNDRLVSTASATYPYRAYLETLCNYGREAKETQFGASLWSKDTAGQMDIADPSGTNEGLKERSRFTAKSKIVDMMGGLHADVTSLARLLLNNVSVRLKLNRSKDAFCIMGGDPNTEYRAVITEAILYVRKVKLEPHVVVGIAKALEQGTAKYPMRRVEINTIAVPRGMMNVNKDNLFLGALPRLVIVGLVDTDAFNGTYGKNPFHFQHHKLNSIGLVLDGEQIPAKPLRPDFVNNRTVRCYQDLHNHLDKLYRDKGMNITRDEYGNGYTLFAFDISPDGCSGSHYNLIRQGNLKLEISFAAALPNTVNVLVYAEFDNLLEIDRHRDIIFDYTT